MANPFFQPSQHTFEGAGAPTLPPPSKNSHYVDTSTGDIYISKDTNFVTDWVMAVPAGGPGMNELTGDVLAGPGAGAQAATIPAAVVTSKLLTGLPIGPGPVVASDSLLQAIDKLNNLPADSGITELTGDILAGPGNGSQAATLPDAVATGKLLTGLPAYLFGEVLAADSILQAIAKLVSTSAMQSVLIPIDVVVPSGFNLIRGETELGAGVTLEIENGATVYII